MSRFKKIWNDTVWSKVIAFGIITLCSTMFFYIKSIIYNSTFQEAFISIFKYPNIIYTIIIIIILLGVGMFIYLKVNRKKASSREQLLTKTREDNITENENDIANDLDKTIITEAPTVFFHYRVCDSFPGVESFKWINDPYAAIERLLDLLKIPTYFDEAKGYGTTTDPIWWFNGRGALPIRSFERLDSTHCLMEYEELNIKKIAIVRGSSYFHDFVYIETNIDMPTGLYENEEQVKAYLKKGEHYDEEYAIFNGTFITRSEYDDGAAERNGKIIKTNSAELRKRHLTPYNFIISSKYSPFNSLEFSKKAPQFFKNLLSGSIDFESFIDFMHTLPKHHADH